MMSGHGANPIFFNKKSKDWTSITLAKPPPPLRLSHFCLTPAPLPPQSGRRMCIIPININIVFHKIELAEKWKF